MLYLPYKQINKRKETLLNIKIQSHVSDPISLKISTYRFYQTFILKQI